MGMLDRIKRRQLEGFKEFVLNIETTGATTRQQILMAGILEDPLFMSYVMRNVKTFEDFLGLPSDDIDSVLGHQNQLLAIFAKCLHGLTDEKILSIITSQPKFAGRIREELSCLSEVNPTDREGARFFIMKVVRKLQTQESINGFKWDLPPQDLFHPKVVKDGKQEIFFESGILACEGENLKNKRTGRWKHFYDTGKIMAEGDYQDGLKFGSWTFYYGNGNQKSQGRYRDDLKQGRWEEWDRSGVLTESEFHEGVKKT